MIMNKFIYIFIYNISFICYTILILIFILLEKAD